MRRLVVGMVAGAALAAPAQAAAPAPARLLVQADEFRLSLSRAAVAAGPAVVQLAVVGEDPHDLRLRRLDRRGRATGPTRKVREVLPGGLGEWRGRLARGRWKLWCSLDGHARAGMRATLRAR